MVDFEERVEVYLHNFGCFSSEELVSRLVFIKIWPLILDAGAGFKDLFYFYRGTWGKKNMHLLFVNSL